MFVSYNNFGQSRSVHIHVGRVIHHCEVCLGQELGVVSGWVEREAGSEEIAFIESVQTEFHHFLGQLLVLDPVLAVWVKLGSLVVSSKLEVD